MAKVKGPLHAAEARGKCGSLVYNTWRGIRWVKDFAAPIQPDSGTQLDQRAALGAVAAVWKTLTPQQRTAWDLYASEHVRIDWTGSPVKPSGFNWFLSCSLPIYKYTGLTLADPPAAEPPPLPTILDVNGGSGTILIAWTPIDGTSPGQHMVEAYLAGPYSAGRKPDFHHAVFIDSAWDFPGELEIVTPTYDWYGLWLRRLDRETGLHSTWQTYKVFTIAP